MSEKLVILAKAEAKQERDKKRINMSREERGALIKMRQEAKAKGVKLHNNGVGGLPASVALHVFRRDGYTCKKCGRTDSPIGLHHKGGIPDSEWLKKKGHINELNNMATICDKCHDSIHQEARQEGVGEQKPNEQNRETDKKKEQNGPVGKHSDLDDSKFDPTQLAMGIEHELEHTDDRDIAKAITKDHLAEIPDYYTRLDAMEAQTKRGKK
jgi:hypothetical protein